MKRALTIVSSSVALLALSATATIAQTNAPTLKIVSPAEGQTIYSTKIPTLVSPTNFAVVDYQMYKTVQRSQGHVHLWLDDASPTKESATKVTALDFAYTDVPYGDHTLKAELVNNNHSSLNPPVVTTVSFKSAAASTPSPTATSSGFDKNTALVILIVVALVIVAAWWYTKDEDESPAKGPVEDPERSRRERSRSTTKRKSSKRRKS